MEFSGEAKEEVMEKMHPHYMEVHKDIMASATEERKKEWFEKFNKNWESAPEAQ